MVFSLGLIFGCGVMINFWIDIKNIDLVIVMGGNVVEVYFCGFKWVIEVKVYCGVKLIVVDLCFICIVLVVDYYVLICLGLDIVFLMVMINWMIQNDKVQWDYVCNYINVVLIVKDEFGWQDGLFSGYDLEKCDYDKLSWDYVIGEDGFVVIDMML